MQLPHEQEFCSAHQTLVPEADTNRDVRIVGRVVFDDDLSTLYGLAAAVARLDRIPMLNAHLRFGMGGGTDWKELFRHGHSGFNDWKDPLEGECAVAQVAHPGTLPFGQLPPLVSDEYEEESSEEEDEEDEEADQRDLKEKGGRKTASVAASTSPDSRRRKEEGKQPLWLQVPIPTSGLRNQISLGKKGEGK